MPVVVHVALSSAINSPYVWPNASIVCGSLDNSSPHLEQYTTKSYEPSASHVASILFSTTASLGLCPNAGIIIWSNVISVCNVASE